MILDYYVIILTLFAHIKIPPQGCDVTPWFLTFTDY